MTLSIRRFHRLLAALLLLAVTSRAMAGESIIYSDFNDLTPGTAPDNFEPAGRWEIKYSKDVEHDSSRWEDDPNMFTIVERSIFDEGATGNSLRAESMNFTSHAAYSFDNGWHEADVDIVSAKFEIWVPDGEQSGPFVYLGGNDSDYSLDPRDRGPYFFWDSNGGLQAVTCTNALGCLQNPTTVVETTPVDEWQYIELEIDLKSDTYNVFWSTNDSPPELMARYVPFSANQDFFDQIGFANFSRGDLPGVKYAGGVAYIDNVSVESLAKIPGDANYDGAFNSGDLVTVFKHGLFETGEIATWRQGDWNGDRVFDTGDLVAAFQDGGYEQGAQVAAVPEPSCLVMMTLGLLTVGRIRKR